MLQLDGKTLPYNRAFSHKGISYPANWLSLSTQSERAAIGIKELPDPAPAIYDARFYWAPNVPKDLLELQKLWIELTKAQANNMLSKTDWYVIRQAEVRYQMPTEVSDARELVRTKCDEKEKAIAACADVAALYLYINGTDYTDWSDD